MSDSRFIYSQINVPSNESGTQIFSQYKLALASRDRKTAMSLWNQHGQLLRNFKVADNFTELVNFFELVLDIHVSEMIGAYWNNNQNLQQWYQGAGINWGTTDQPIWVCINDITVLNLIKNVLSTSDPELVSEILTNNHVFSLIPKLPHSELINILKLIVKLKIDGHDKAISTMRQFINSIVNIAALFNVYKSNLHSSMDELIRKMLYDRYTYLHGDLTPSNPTPIQNGTPNLRSSHNTPSTSDSETSAVMATKKRGAPNNGTHTQEPAPKKRKIENSTPSLTNNSSSGIFAGTRSHVKEPCAISPEVRIIQDHFPTIEDLKIITLDSKNNTQMVEYKIHFKLPSDIALTVLENSLSDTLGIILPEKTKIISSQTVKVIIADFEKYSSLLQQYKSNKPSTLGLSS